MCGYILGLRGLGGKLCLCQGEESFFMVLVSW